MSMRIAIGVGAQVIGEAVRPQDIVDEVVRAEADGFGSGPALPGHAGMIAGWAVMVSCRCVSVPIRARSAPG